MDESTYDYQNTLLDARLGSRVPRDWALEASVLESSYQRDLHL